MIKILLISVGCLIIFLLLIESLGSDQDGLFGFPIEQTSCPTPSCDEQ